ncbi:MAG: PA2169 family four-helix-bundle protein [Ferruginibacter sp.]
MERNQNSIAILKNLIEINSNRTIIYQKVSEECKSLDIDLHWIFNTMANESRRYVSELTREAVKMGGEPVIDPMSKGKIYQVWMDVTATFSGCDRQSILESCEFVEDTIQREYNKAIAGGAELDARIIMIIVNQKAYLKTTHKLVKNYRDAYFKMIY